MHIKLHRRKKKKKEKRSKLPIKEQITNKDRAPHITPITSLAIYPHPPVTEGRTLPIPTRADSLRLLPDRNKTCLKKNELKKLI